MNRAAYRLAASTAFLCLAASPALAQKSGGILRIQHFDSPASMSILEESTRAALQPMMAVFNNLVMFDQHVKQNSLQSTVADLASAGTTQPTEIVVGRTGRARLSLPRHFSRVSLTGGLNDDPD